MSEWLKKHVKSLEGKEEVVINVKFFDELLKRLGKVMAEFYKGNYEVGIEELSKLGEEIYSYYKTLIDDGENVNG
ncbi:hypothetical protein Ferp_0975 [Ferroglobus placidus DSM 10642]|uniref:Uncharacterized protein n=1 Tax=Ferroglobus placidus (strain DSM 10642 / AEDII12DO) TaxID=589924 RepID=D3RXC6_FERPA|nr:hypothetical protein [Ferroglobus placidus]ADC65139.1 hypothetical protein Ferp_0975 [Ferroglobus placidus DSM 10642]